MRLGFVIVFVFASFTHIFSFHPNKASTVSEVSLGNYYQSVSDYFKASQKEIRLIKESNLKDEEIPVIYFIARSANANVEDVANMRACGLRWMDIAKYYDLAPKVFYSIECNDNMHCKKHGSKFMEKKYSRINSLKRFSDKQIQTLVNIKFISEDHLCSSSYVKKLRKEGSDFVSINEQIIQEHKEHLEKLRSQINENNKTSMAQN